MKSTENYGLNKPEVTDIYNVNDFNDNMDIIDSKLKEIAENAESSSTEELNKHLKDTDNPHNVTAEQVGLGNVDNTSDEDKPVSKAVQAEIDKLKQAIIDVDAMNEVTGSPILLTDVASGVLEDFNAKGRSKQNNYGYSGKNLYDTRGISTITSNGITVTPVYDDNGLLLYVNANGTATERTTIELNSGTTLPSGIYTLTGCPDGDIGTYYLEVCTSDSVVIGDGDGQKFMVTKDTDECVMFIVVCEGQTVNNIKFYPMISIEGGEYEPYVTTDMLGPSPTYLQAIKSNGDMGYFDGELLQGMYNNSGVFTANATDICSKNPIPCKDGDVIKLIYGEVVPTIAISFYDENMTFISRPYTFNASEYETTAPTNAKYMNFHIDFATNITPQTAKHICVTINDKYALIVDSIGKNLLKPTSTGRTINGVTFSRNADNSWSVKGTATATNTFCNINYVDANTKTIPNGNYILTGGKDGVKLQVYQDEKWTNTSMNGNPSATVINSTTGNWLRLEVDNGVTVDTVIYPMIRPLGTDDTYEPYIHSRKYIPISAPLRGIGSSYIDIIKSNGNLYGEGRNTLQITYDGSESGWFRNTISDVPCFSIARPSNSIRGSKALCTHFVNADTVTNNNAFTVGSSYVNFRNDDIATATDWKAWLAENPITVIMPISEEVFEPFADQTPFYDIVTFEGVTHISCSDDAEMWVQYYSNSNVGQRLAKTNAELDKMNEHIVTSEEAIGKLEDFATHTTSDIEDIQSNIELLQGYTDWVVISAACSLSGSGGSTGTVTNDIKYKLKNSIVYLTGKLDALHWIGAPELSLGTIDATIAPTEDTYFNLVGIDSTDVEHAIPMVLKIDSTGEVTLLKSMSGKSIVNDICINVSYPIDYTGVVG